MRPAAFYFFEYTPPGAKRPKRTTYRMTIEDAAQRLPGAVPVEWSKEIRNLPDDGDVVNGGLGFLATAAPGFKPWQPQPRAAVSAPATPGHRPCSSAATDPAPGPTGQR